MRWSWPADRLSFLLPVLALVAEGAWLAVVYVAVETTIDRQAPLLGTFELAVAAGLAALAVRRGWLHPDEDPLPFFGALVGVGAAGWLWDATPRELLAAGNLVDAIGLHPGGWLTIVAFMRGAGRGLEVDDRAVSRLVLVGVPALALPWTLGQIAAGELRPIFTEEAFVASLTFVSAGFMAAGLARLQAIGEETGVDWRRNRSWLGMVVGVLAVVLALGVPAAFLLGLPVEAVARGLLGPVATLLGYLLLGVAVILAFISAGIYLILSNLGVRLPPPMTPEEVARLPVIREYRFEDLRGPLLGVGILWVLLVLLAIILLRTWLSRRGHAPARASDEERSFRIPQTSLRMGLPRLARRRRPRGTPRDAVTAYLAALEALAAEGGGDLGRHTYESPRAHATRVLSAAPHTVDPALAPLQADYALARYAGRQLTRREHARAIGRWRRLRERLRGGH